MVCKNHRVASRVFVHRQWKLISLQKHCKFNVEGFDGYDSTQPDSFGLFIDINSMYSSILSDYLPTGKMEEVLFDSKNIDFVALEADKNHGYMLLIDYQIKDDCKLMTDNLPLSLKNREVVWDQLSPETKELCDACNIDLIII